MKILGSIQIRTRETRNNLIEFEVLRQKQTVSGQKLTRTERHKCCQQKRERSHASAVHEGFLILTLQLRMVQRWLLRCFFKLTTSQIESKKQVKVGSYLSFTFYPSKLGQPHKLQYSVVWYKIEA